MRSFTLIVVFVCLVVGIDNTMAFNIKHKFRILESRVNTLELQSQGILSNSERISDLNETVMGLDQCSPDEKDDNDFQSSDGQRGNVKMEDRDENQQTVDIRRAFAEEKLYIRQFEQRMNEGLSEFKKEMRKAASQENATIHNMIEQFASSFDDLQSVLNTSLNMLEMKQTEDTESIRSYIDQITSEQTGLKTLMNDIKLYINRENNFDNWWKRCHSGWTKRKGFLYKIFSEKVTYAEAQQACAACNSHVVDVQDEEEWTFVEGLVDGSFWLGATDTATEGTWIWDRTGKEITYQ